MFIILSCMVSCKKAPLTVGKIVTESRELSAFNEVHLNDDINLTLVRSDTNYIEITTGQNIIDNITTDIAGDVLTISNTSYMSWIRPYDYKREAVLYYKDIKSFIFASCGTLTSANQYNDSTNNYYFEVNGGSGDIDLDVSNCSNLYFRYQYGTSRVNLHGNNNKDLVVHKRSYGIFDASDCQTEDINITNVYVGDCYIYATKSIVSEITQFGNIYYKGNPDSIVEKYGPNSKGKLIKL